MKEMALRRLDIPSSFCTVWPAIVPIYPTSHASANGRWSNARYSLFEVAPIFITTSASVLGGSVASSSLAQRRHQPPSAHHRPRIGIAPWPPAADVMTPESI